MHAIQVLEFDTVKERLVNCCETSLGGELASALAPLFDPPKVWDLLKLTAEAHDAVAKHQVPSLGAIRDLRKPLMIASKGGVIGGVELFQVADSLMTMRNLRTFLRAQSSTMPRLSAYAEGLPDAKRLEEQLFDSLEPDGSVKDAASVTLSNLRQKKKNTTSRIQERIQSYTTGKTRELLSDPIYTVRDGRYVIPLKAENRGKIRGIVHDTSGSGQTIFVEPEDVLQLGNALREIEAGERTEVARILTQLSAKVGTIAVEAIGGIEAASHIDLALAKARLAYDMKGTMPIPQGNAWIQIQGGKHPLLNPETTVPLELSVGKGSSVLITGPNTGGKTVAIKTVGLFVLMAQSGLMPPALDIRLGPFTQVWADIGDEQSLQQSLSTFSGHIKNISDALRGMKPGALVLLDEAGAGTDPAEGAALAQAILLEMSKRGAAILASTHYGELKAFAYNYEGFQNAAMEFDPKTLRPTYRLVMGAPGSSQALRIAERYGIPKPIVEQAREGLGVQARDVAAMMEQLELSQRQARIAQSEADRRADELKKSEARAARKLAEAEEIRKNAHAKANEVIEAALREIRLEAARLFEELKHTAGDQRGREEVRRQLSDLQEVGRDFADEFLPKRSSSDSPSAGSLHKGSTVRIEGYSQPGTIVDAPKGKTVLVQVGAVKITVPISSLSVVESRPVTAKPRASLQLSKAMSATTELHLRHMRAEEALRDLEKFLDDALLAGLPSIRIIHGKGEGILRKVTQEYLRKHPGVATFRDGEPAEGGHGATVVTFK
ncbi:MAG: endonuclease MutS2 [Fimbriimonas sp.]|nr:endonuclease MutS2 [Fimbriimonas sp.]